MLSLSGGEFWWPGSRLSRSFTVTQISRVAGLTATPTAFRRPEANTRPFAPDSSNRITVARVESRSTHTLHDEPSDTYIALSGPKTIVRVECPLPPP